MAEPLHKQTAGRADEDRATYSAAYEAVVSTDASAEDDTVMVTIDSFDGGIAEHGPCPWMPRVTIGGVVELPSTGDRALVVKNETGDPWIVAWWPF